MKVEMWFTEVPGWSVVKQSIHLKFTFPRPFLENLYSAKNKKILTGTNFSSDTSKLLQYSVETNNM